MKGSLAVHYLSRWIYALDCRSRVIMVTISVPMRYAHIRCI